MDHFLPGTAAGGPVGSIRNFTLALRNYYDIEIVTRDCEFRSHERYSPEAMEAVRAELGVPIHYLRADNSLLVSLARVLRAKRDTTSVVYLNSFFARKFSHFPQILLRTLGYKGRIVVATRGELTQGALSIKKRRKALFLQLGNRLGWFTNLQFHASTEIEKAEILRVLPGADVAVARVIPTESAAPDARREATTWPSREVLQIALISRIAPVKNHRFLIDLMREVPGRVHLVFAGTMDVIPYWDDCRRSLALLPSRVTWEYVGLVSPQERLTLLESSHIFALPTLGESYGHAIAEALDAGCPTLISDRTPWHGLAEAGVGADLPLADPARWVKVITDIRDMSDDDYFAMRERARTFRERIFPPEVAIAENRALFDRAIEAADPHLNPAFPEGAAS